MNDDWQVYGIRGCRRPPGWRWVVMLLVTALFLAAVVVPGMVERYIG